MQIYILHSRNSGVGSMELENAFCCPIVPFHKDFSPSGEQLEHCKLAHEL